MLSVPLSLLFLSALVSAERKASFILGNSSVPLSPRDLLTRQYTCADPSDGMCDTGQCCPLDGGCCGSNNCAYAGEACCGNNGYVYPLDGSECCSDGSHCDPGASCYECVDYPGEVCCYDPDRVASYSAAVNGAYTSYTAAVESANDHNSAVWSSYTAHVSSAVSSYNAAWSSYDVAVSSYVTGGGGYEYQYYYSTYYYYVIIWYTTTIAQPILTSSSSSTSTVLSAYCTNSVEAQLSWSSLAQSVESQVSYSAVQSSNALSSLPAATASFSESAVAAGGGGSSANGVGSIVAGREGVIGVVLPIVGFAVGILAILL